MAEVQVLDPTITRTDNHVNNDVDVVEMDETTRAALVAEQMARSLQLEQVHAVSNFRDLFGNGH